MRRNEGIGVEEKYGGWTRIRNIYISICQSEEGSIRERFKPGSYVESAPDYRLKKLMYIRIDLQMTWPRFEVA